MKTSHPAWGYRRAEDGSVEAMLFPDGRPDGWFDSPAHVPDQEIVTEDGERLIGKPSDGAKRRTSDQVDHDEALIALAAEKGVTIPEGSTVAQALALIEG